MKYTGYDNDNNFVTKHHIRAKGINRETAKNMKIEDFKDMLFNQESKSFELTNFVRSYENKKHLQKERGITSETTTKVINKNIWTGRKLNIDKNRWESW